MNRTKLIVSVVLGIVAVCGVISVENEFIQKPKEKKFYPSCHQCIELKADVIGLVNKVQSSLNRLNGWSIAKQQMAIADIALYVEGDKECFLQKATKHERATGYTQDMRIKQQLEEILVALANINDTINKK